jgi:hypothetical protein
MATAKKPPAMPYTGNTDPSEGPRPGTIKFGEIMASRWKFTNLGIWANRPMRGTNPPRLSVHATGRAIDLGYTAANAALVGKVCLWLEANHVALGIEEIHDYSGVSKKGAEMWGRGFRCNRNGVPGWKEWSESDNGGTPGMGKMASKWIHLELAPAPHGFADDPKLLVKAFKAISGTAPAALA